MTQATELRELASLIHVDGSNSYVGVSSTAFTPTDAFVVKADGARITVESADMEVAMLGRRGSSGVALDSGYLRLRNQGVTADGVVLDSDANLNDDFLFCLESYRIQKEMMFYLDCFPTVSQQQVHHTYVFYEILFLLEFYNYI